MDRVVASLAHAHADGIPFAYALGPIIPMPLADRKLLLTLCRIQVPERDSQKDVLRIYRSLRARNFFCNSHGIPPTTFSLDHIEHFIHNDWTNPVLLGLISMLLRCLPVSEDEARDALQESMQKEFDTTQGAMMKSPLQQLDYSFLFLKEPTPLHRYTHISPTIFEVLLSGIDQFKRAVQSDLIFPRMSNKSCSLSTRLSYAQAMKEYDWMDHQVSLCDVEILYSRTGFRCGGDVEMRQAWKYNDLKPRTYFAAGGDAYFASRYIQPIMNALVNAFPATDTFGRFSLERFSQLSDDELVVLYDYTSFTSNMPEQRHFLDSLASAMSGVLVTLVDSREGPLQKDLGDLLKEYNDICNHQAQFTFGPRLMIEGVYRHMVAGFLGVYGNISSCTALHGISLLSILSHHDGASVVGDDAMARFMKGDMDVASFREHVEILGVVAQEKYKEFPDEWIDADTYARPARWHYTKRPVQRLAGKMYIGNLHEWPMLPYMITNGSAATSYHTVKNNTPAKALKAWCFQTGRFLDSIRRWELDAYTEEVVWTYLREGYRAWGLRFSGSTPHYLPHHHLHTPAYPCIDGTMNIDEDWVEFLVGHSYGDIVELPVLFDPSLPRPVLSADVPALFHMTKLLSFAMKMEWVVGTPLYESVALGPSSRDRFIQYLRGYPVTYTYEFVLGVDPPDWFQHMYSLVADA